LICCDLTAGANPRPTPQKTNLYLLLYSLSHFSAKNDSPLKDGAEAQIEFDIKCGQGRALSAKNT
jgi:hypothetical protein